MRPALIFVADERPVVARVGLSDVARSHSLRCDAKQAEERFATFDRLIESIESFELGAVLPGAFVKGEQPRYFDDPDQIGVPVVNTMAIQNLSINVASCRSIDQDQYDEMADERKPRPGDVLLTMDGGTSIGKPALFDLDEDFAVDSHVAILRPAETFDARYLVLLLASPLGQLQFDRYESGASGQTAVTEDDIRRFRFPLLEPDVVCRIVDEFDERRRELSELYERVRDRESEMWNRLSQSLVNNSKLSG